MKELFDPRPKTVLINSKYGSQRHSTVYTSYLLLTNHTDAVGHLGGDRRVYVIENTTKVESSAYFVELNRWLDEINEKGAPAWAESVWRYLMTLTPDIAMLNAPAPMTAAKLVMVDETQNEYDHIAAVLIDLFKGVIPTSVINGLVTDILEYRGDINGDIRASIVLAILKKGSRPAPALRKVNSKATRLRVMRSAFNENDELLLQDYADKNLENVRELMSNEHDLIVKVNALVDARL